MKQQERRQGLECPINIVSAQSLNSQEEIQKYLQIKPKIKKKSNSNANIEMAGSNRSLTIRPISRANNLDYQKEI